MTIVTNRHGLPAAMVAAMAADDYDRGHADISVTGLVNPPRLEALRERHQDEIEEDAADLVWRLLGKAVHRVLEAAGQDALTEERLYLPVCPKHGIWRGDADHRADEWVCCKWLWTISGKFDNLTLEETGDLYTYRPTPLASTRETTWHLCDWKVTSVFAVKEGVKPEWEAQLNLYALLLRHAGFQVTSLAIGAILRDWRRADAERDPDYPRKAAVELPVPLWSPDRQEAYLLERVRLHQQARAAAQLPPCTDEERWARPAKWAVTRAGQQRAVRLFDDREEAMRFLPTVQGGRIEFRPGRSIRCEAYCPVLQFCDQGQALTGQARG